MSNGLPLIAHKLMEIMETELVKNGRKNETKGGNLKDISTIREVSKANYGFIIYRKLWNKFKLSDLLSSITKNRKKRSKNIPIEGDAEGRGWKRHLCRPECFTG